MAYQITSNWSVCSKAWLGQHQIKYQSLALLAHCEGIYRWLVVSPYKGASNVENTFMSSSHHESNVSCLDRLMKPYYTKISLVTYVVKRTLVLYLIVIRYMMYDMRSITRGRRHLILLTEIGCSSYSSEMNDTSFHTIFISIPHVFHWKGWHTKQ